MWSFSPNLKPDRVSTIGMQKALLMFSMLIVCCETLSCVYMLVLAVCCVVRALQCVTIICCTAPIFRVLARWWPLLLRSERKKSFSKCKIRSLIMEWSLVWTVQTNSNCHILSQTFNEIQMFIQIIEANIPISKQFQIWMNTSIFTAIIFVWSR